MGIRTLLAVGGAVAGRAALPVLFDLPGLYYLEAVREQESFRLL